MATTSDGSIYAVWRHVYPGNVRVSTEGTPRHPQLVIDARGSLLAAWDEAGTGTRRVVVAHAVAAASGPVRFTREVIGGAGSDQYPVIAATDGGIVVAWVNGAPDRSVIRVRSEPFSVNGG